MADMPDVPHTMLEPHQERELLFWLGQFQLQFESRKFTFTALWKVRRALASLINDEKAAYQSLASLLGATLLKVVSREFYLGDYYRLTRALPEFLATGEETGKYAALMPFVTGSGFVDDKRVMEAIAEKLTSRHRGIVRRFMVRRCFRSLNDFLFCEEADIKTKYRPRRQGIGTIPLATLKEALAVYGLRFGMKVDELQLLFGTLVEDIYGP